MLFFEKKLVLKVNLSKTISQKKPTYWFFVPELVDSLCQRLNKAAAEYNVPVKAVVSHGAHCEMLPEFDLLSLLSSSFKL